jgi:glycine/D-amino acid oxidase-like deaminating enzyme
MRIAVAGAGFQGACVALELSRRGHSVELLDREAEPVTQAGVGNEGKIHLGLTDAKDASEPPMGPLA